MGRRRTAEQLEKIRTCQEMKAGGATYAEMGERLGVSRSAVYDFLKFDLASPDIVQVRLKARPTLAIVRSLVEMRRQGHTVAEIALRHGIEYQQAMNWCSEAKLRAREEMADDARRRGGKWPKVDVKNIDEHMRRLRVDYSRHDVPLTGADGGHVEIRVMA